MKNKLGLALEVAALIIAALAYLVPASAMDLSQAKAAGLVGEQLDGYIGLVKPDATQEAKALVNNTNAQRRIEYERIAKKNGVNVEEVARLAARKVIEQSPPGQYVQTPSGWRRR